MHTPYAKLQGYTLPIYGLYYYYYIFFCMEEEGWQESVTRETSVEMRENKIHAEVSQKAMVYLASAVQGRVYRCSKTYYNKM